MALSQFDQEHIGNIVAGNGDWFTAKLLRLIAKADSVNLEKLRQAFPEEVNAFLEWKQRREESC